MNILILGSGIVGANLANKLSEQGKSVFLLDDDASELKRLSERYDIKPMLKNSESNSDLYDMNYKEAKVKFERDYLILKLKNNNWNMTLTSKNLNLDRVSLYRKIKSLNIKID